MSRERDHHEHLGRRPTGTASSPGTASTDTNTRHGGIDDRRVSGARARIVPHGAKPKRPEADRERLAHRVRALEANVAKLEAEAAGSERPDEGERKRRQRVIDRYERVIAEKEAANRRLRSDAEAAVDAGATRPLAAVRSWVRTACAGVRRLVSSG